MVVSRHPECPLCKCAMERGFILDMDRSRAKSAERVAGEPVPSFWTGLKTRGARKRSVVAFRCPGCGLLQQYAR